MLRMVRNAMAEYIEREALLKKMKKWHTKERLIDCVKDTPAADVVGVVRCKDCKYREELPNKNIWCAHHFVFMAMKPDDYCSKGERKEENK